MYKNVHTEIQKGKFQEKSNFLGTVLAGASCLVNIDHNVMLTRFVDKTRNNFGLTQSSKAPHFLDQDKHRTLRYPCRSSITYCCCEICKLF